MDSVASAVKTLAVPISRISAQKDNSNKNSQSWRVEKEDITAYTLARQYVLLLCRLDLLEVRQISSFYVPVFSMVNFTQSTPFFLSLS